MCTKCASNSTKLCQSSFGYVAIGKMQWIPRYKHGQAMIVNILAITKLKTIVKNCVRYP